MTIKETFDKILTLLSPTLAEKANVSDTLIIDTSGLVDGDLIQWDESTGEFIPYTPVAGGGLEESVYYPSGDTATTSAAGVAISGVNIPIVAGERYSITGLICFGASGTGGMGFGPSVTVTPASIAMLFFGRTNNVNVFTSQVLKVIGLSTSTPLGTVASTFNWATVNGTIVGGASDGVLTILFGPVVGGQTITILESGTYFKVTKLS